MDSYQSGVGVVLSRFDDYHGGAVKLDGLDYKDVYKRQALNAPYFDTVCTSACMYPISQALIDELGVDNMVGMTNETMWYTGPYFETTFTMNNEKILTKNENYFDKDAKLFDTVTVRMVDGTQLYQLWQNGELDNIALAEACLLYTSRCV